MNKSVLIGAILVLAAGAGYYQFSHVPAQEAAAQRQAEEQAAAEAARKAAEEAAAKAAAEAEAAARKQAEEAAAKAVAEAEAAARKLAEEAAAKAKSALEGAAQALGNLTGTAPEALSGLVAMLDPANFDATKLSAALDATTLDESTRMTLKTLVEAAGANPAMVDTAITQIKAALGL